ncbi:MAG: hypothetical protein J6K66_07715 [Clostridia bacterium]|nr:hypothetical protein [Clostridia bacterium]
MRVLNTAAAALYALLIIVFTCLGSFSEISDYDVVSGIGVDFEKNQWLVTCEICMPSVDNDFGSSSIYIEGKGDTLDSAFEDAGRRSANILYTGGNQLYLIGENARGKAELYEYFLKDGVNLRAVAVYSQGRAADTLSAGKDDENSRAKSLAMAKKVSRFCAEQGMPLPKVTEYLKGGQMIIVSEEETPSKAVADNA